MLVSLIILALYFWAFFAGVSNVGAALLVHDSAAVLAGASLLTAVVSYLWAPKNHLFAGSLFAYGILVVTTAVLVLGTGGPSSPFIALWMLISVFAGIFGAYGLLPLLLAVTSYMLLEFFTGSIGREAVVTIVLTGELPLVASYIIFHTKSRGHETKEDRAYHELASELRQVAGKSEVVINAIADGVIALNNDGTIELINPAAQRLIGWGRQDALSLNYKTVLKLTNQKGEELQPSTDPITQAIANNKLVSTNDLTLITSSGKKLLISVVVSPVGQPGSGVIVVFRDITKEKAEEREQAEFISTASHEMRTPVASIEGYLGLAMNPSTAQIDEKARLYITKAHESAQHLGRLFQDLLDVSRADDGRLSNNPKVVDVVAFVHDITEGLQPKAAEKGLTIVFKPESEVDDGHGSSERRVSPVYYVNVDNDHLREVVANVVENAIKYTPSGTVTVDVTGDDDKVLISVADTGIGIPAEDMPHLFQKFYRVDNSATREIGGTGLGLYLCRRLTEAMNGRIWAESRFKEGSTFYVELPRTPHEEATRLIEKMEQEQAVAQAQQPVAPILPPDVQAALQQTASQAQPQSPAEPPQEVQLPQTVTPAAPQAPAMPSQGYAAPSVTTPVPPSPAPQSQVAAQVPPVVTPYSIRRQIPSNIPLSAIEQNPGQYTRGRNMNIPPRA